MLGLNLGLRVLDVKRSGSWVPSLVFGLFGSWFLGRSFHSFYMLAVKGEYLDPQLPSNIPQIPTIEGHRRSLGKKRCIVCVALVVHRIQFRGLRGYCGLEGLVMPCLQVRTCLQICTVSSSALFPGTAPLRLAAFL